MISLELKDVPGFGILYFGVNKKAQKCVICGGETFFKVIASDNYFEGTEHEHWPCCQNSCCYDELVAQKRQEVYQDELSMVFSGKERGERHVF